MISGIFLCSGHFEGHFACVCHWFFFPVRDLNVNFKITQELRMNTSSNTATHNSKSFKLTLWYSNIAADNSPQMMFPTIKLQFMESPSVVTWKFPSDMTRTRFLGYDACPRLWREVFFCVAGVALGAIDGPLVWHVLCMVTSTLRFCSFPSDLTRGVCLMRVHLCGAWWHRRCVSVAGAARKSSRVFYDAADRVRGRRASVGHRRSLCMARVVLGDLDGAWLRVGFVACAKWAGHDASYLSSWHCGFWYCGRRGTWWHRRCFSVAGVALVGIDSACFCVEGVACTNWAGCGYAPSSVWRCVFYP